MRLSLTATTALCTLISAAASAAEPLAPNLDKQAGPDRAAALDEAAKVGFQALEAAHTRQSSSVQRAQRLQKLLSAQGLELGKLQDRMFAAYEVHETGEAARAPSPRHRLSV